MKKITVLLIALSIVSCTPTTDLLGDFTRADLEHGGHNRWFTENYEAHLVNKNIVSQIDSLFNDIEVTIYMGTWCEDRRREVPAFFKILDSLDANDHVDRMIGVSEDKVSPDGSAKKAGITNVPTFVFSKNGEEINRIVEFPIISLEQDLLDILQGNGYKHAYDF
jgi:thiol-disulfide isomerase/thioredoxin